MRFLGTLFLLVLICSNSFALSLSDSQKRSLVENARSKALIYLGHAVKYIENNPKLQYAAGGRDIAAELIYIQARLGSSSWSFKVQTMEYASDCSAAEALSDGDELLICDSMYTDTDNSGMVNALIHETYHQYQKHVLQMQLVTSPEIECTAAEVAAVPMLVAGNYEIETGYIEISQLSDGRCDTSSYFSTIKAVHDQIKANSKKLAVGQIIQIKRALTDSDIVNSSPESYIFFVGNYEKGSVAATMNGSTLWVIDDIAPGKAIQTIKLKDTRTGANIELKAKTTGLNIYTDDFEAAFSHKIKVAGVN